MQHAQPVKVQIAPVHDVKRPSFKRQDIEYVDIIHLAAIDAHEARDAAAQVHTVKFGDVAPKIALMSRIDSHHVNCP